MRLIALVAVGGALGSVLRHLLGGLVPQRAGAIFPWGTLAVNLAGCLAIGLVSELAESRGAMDPGTRALLVVGLLGGFTTFSAFGNETLHLLRDGERLLAGFNVFANVVIGLAAVWLGRILTAAVWR